MSSLTYGVSRLAQFNLSLPIAQPPQFDLRQVPCFQEAPKLWSTLSFKYGCSN